jgi:L-2-hydroxyglutarate oxidase LhgO
LHAGFYYTADSLKARFCREGNRMLTEYCMERNLALNKCGKLVVARNAEELAGIQILYDRGLANGVKLDLLSAEEARRIEPRARTYEKALFSPTTSSVDPLQVLSSLVQDARAAGVKFSYQTLFHSQLQSGDGTSRLLFLTGGQKKKIAAGYVVNCAGLYADQIAHDFGFGQRYTILPFKGLYIYSNEEPGTLACHIYPVPDLNNPFLGVHHTLTVKGQNKIGPTAIPAFWREQYGGFSRFRAGEVLSIITRQVRLFLSAGFDFRNLALSEIKKYRRKTLVAQAAELCSGIVPENFTKRGRPGIRAQLLDRKENKLIMDFLLEGDKRSLHVLNAVSPAFTCALPFASHVADTIDRLAGAV